MAGPAEFGDFDLAVVRSGDGFDVRVLGSPAGESAPAHVRFAAPDPRWTGDQQAATAARDVGASSPPAPPDRRAAGAALFDAVFTGTTLVRFRESRRLAADRGTGLRVVVRAGPAADALPWELLYDTEFHRHLALDPATPVVRCIEMPTAAATPARRGPLRILVAVATPVGLPPIDADRELSELAEVLAPLVRSGVLELVPVIGASLEAIRAALAGGDVHVFHYIGHGSRLPDGRGALDLAGSGGSSSTRAGEELAAILATAPALRLAVLNSCHGAATAPDDPFAGPAAALVRGGVPAVVAMRQAIGDRAAIELARTFYGELVAGACAEAAITSARAALYARDDALAADWPVAALYLSSALAAGATASLTPRIDDDVQFTVSRPGELRAARWETMLVFGHRAGPYAGPGGATVDPQQLIRQRVAGFFGPGVATTSTADARAGIAHGAGLVVLPDLPDVEVDPPQAAMTWTGDVEEVRFLLRAGAHRAGTTIEGWVRVFCGPLVVAETAVQFGVVADSPVTPPDLAPQAITSYRRIFPCFSPRDADLVAGVAAVAESLGDRYTADVIAGRREDAPEEWMLPLIDEADVFQLFWSSHSMRSPTCRRQWEAALATGRADFIRPLYWEQPFPRAPDLPPPDLELLRFVELPAARPESVAATDVAPVAAPDPEAGVPAPPGQVAPPGGLVAVDAGAPPRTSRPPRRWPIAAVVAAAVGGVVAAMTAATTTTPQGGLPAPDDDPSIGTIITVGAVAFAVTFVVVLAALHLLARRRAR